MLRKRVDLKPLHEALAFTDCLPPQNYSTAAMVEPKTAEDILCHQQHSFVAFEKKNTART